VDVSPALRLAQRDFTDARRDDGDERIKVLAVDVQLTQRKAIVQKMRSLRIHWLETHIYLCGLKFA
jgi:hypothetical protein